MRKNWTSETFERANWPHGEWDDEPDRAEWTDVDTKLPCLIVRNLSGALCGYVGVPLDSTLAYKEYNALDDIDVHGGLTYSGTCSGKICHDADEEAYWFGFDTAHYGDYCPALDSLLSGPRVYQNIQYVTNEVTNLARQLKTRL